MRFWMALGCLVSLVCAQSGFKITPELLASVMAKSMESNLPQTFKYKELRLIVQHVDVDGKRVLLDATTSQSKEILDELYKYKTLPDDLKRQCNDFSKVSMVAQGVEYMLRVKDGKRGIEVIYDKEACGESFDPSQKIFVDGYNRYGFDRFGHTKKENAKLKKAS